jgi:hypothetical protein
MSRLPQIEEHTACDVCHRTMLKGEWAEPYLTPSRERRLVCQLCAPHAQREGWIRESAAPHAPAQPQRAPERRGLRRWAARRREAAAEFADEVTKRESENGHVGHEDSTEANGHDEADAPAVLSRLRKRATAPRKPRQIRAVPTNAQLKIGRALGLFNSSEHPRTLTGIARSLGAPHGSAIPSKVSAAEVLLTVAWELSWYQFTVDLSDPREPVQVRAQGQELAELDEDVRVWNLEVDGEGCLKPLGASSDEAVEPEPVAAGQSGGESLD